MCFVESDTNRHTHTHMNMVLTGSRKLYQEAVTLLPVMQMDRMEPMQACTVVGR